MPSAQDGCEDLECCLHGRGCRVGIRQVKKEEEGEQCDEPKDKKEYAASKRRNKSSRHDQALERLARHLKHVEAFSERRERRRQKRAKRRAEAQKNKEMTSTDQSAKKSEAEAKPDGNDYGNSSKHSTSGGACCEMDGTVDVRLTPEEARSLRRSAERMTSKKLKQIPPETRATGNETINADKSNMVRKPAVGDFGTLDDSEADASNSSHQGMAKSIYLGVCNFAKAERNVEKRADFKLYHEMSNDSLLDDLQPELVLTLVYKTANGSYRHYPIRTRSMADSTYYYVESGEKRPIHHISLNHLVRYYQINAQRHPEHQDYADPFPWWEVSS